jgi:hypothetical protein
MAQSPLKSRYSGGQEVPPSLFKSGIHHSVHKSLPLGTILNHVNPVNILCFSKKQFNIILPSVPIPRSDAFPLGSSSKLFRYSFNFVVYISGCETSYEKEKNIT